MAINNGPGDKLKKALSAAYNKVTGRKTSTVEGEYTIGSKNVPFKGTVTEGKRKAVMNVSNPEYGSTKSIERFNRAGALKSQKFIDRNTEGKITQVTKTKVD